MLGILLLSSALVGAADGFQPVNSVNAKEVNLGMSSGWKRDDTRSVPLPRMSLKLEKPVSGPACWRPSHGLR